MNDRSTPKGGNGNGPKSAYFFRIPTKPWSGAR